MDRRQPGKILSLLDLLAEHEQAFVYDWRTRFGLPLEAVFDGRMTWGESWLLTMELVADPSSRVGAAVAGWEHPIDRDGLILADLYDLTLRLQTGRKVPKPYPRPSDPKPVRTQRPTLSQAKILEALRERGHGQP